MNANAYMSESSSLYGMELQDHMQIHSEAVSNMQPDFGLLDCRATASAGLETSIQKQLSSILAQDRAATVIIAKYMRP